MGLVIQRARRIFAPGEKTERISASGGVYMQTDSFMRSLWPFEKKTSIFL